MHPSPKTCRPPATTRWFGSDNHGLAIWAAGIRSSYPWHVPPFWVSPALGLTAS